ncbi:unnamed protein product [Fraxinus pennsylvanica]|uniref:Uncharacterized protein n=1 Tax=Fraxinus pennsylvanica TaxID=56036 RepID=A0AAD1ZC11_9LAMI|nr:unnamed protein product [Fraxinus pennsylvanica]
MDIESHGHYSIVETNEDQIIVSGNPRTLNQVDVSQRNQLPSVSDVWAAVNICGSYCPSTSGSDKYASANEMSLGHLQFIKEQLVRMIDLETDRQDKKDMLCRQPDEMFFFGSYPTQDRDEQIQSLVKGRGSSPYHQEQKKRLLYIQPVANRMVEAAPFSQQFREQTHLSHPLDLRKNRLYNFYMHQNIPASHSHLNGALSQNWYPGERGGHGGSSAIEGSGAICLNLGTSSVSKSGQNLHSIVTECKELGRGATNDSIQQFIQSED